MTTASTDHPDWLTSAGVGGASIVDQLSVTAPGNGSVQVPLGQVANMAMLMVQTLVSSGAQTTFVLKFYSDPAYTLGGSAATSWDQQTVNQLTTFPITPGGPYGLLTIYADTATPSVCTVNVVAYQADTDVTLIIPATTPVAGGTILTAGQTLYVGPFGTTAGRGVLSGGCQDQPWLVALDCWTSGAYRRYAMIGGPAGTWYSADVLLPIGEVRMEVTNFGSGTTTVWRGLAIP